MDSFASTSAIAGQSMPMVGIEASVMALWLGHESIETTHVYLNANLALQEKILE